MSENLQQFPWCSISWIPSGSCLGNCACQVLVLLLRIHQHTRFVRHMLYINSGNVIIIEDTDRTIGKPGRIYMCCPLLRMGLELISGQCEVCPLNTRLLTQLCKKACVASKIFFKSDDCKSTVTNKVILRNIWLISDVFNTHGMYC